PLPDRRRSGVPVHLHRHDGGRLATRPQPGDAAVALRPGLPLVLRRDGRFARRVVDLDGSDPPRQEPRLPEVVRLPQPVQRPHRGGDRPVVDLPTRRAGLGRRDRLVDRRRRVRHVHRRLHLPDPPHEHPRRPPHRPPARATAGATAPPAPAREGAPLITATDTSTADQPDQEIERVPGEGDMWFFVLFESLVFTAYFCVYLYFRTP